MGRLQSFQWHSRPTLLSIRPPTPGHQTPQNSGHFQPIFQLVGPVSKAIVNKNEALKTSVDNDILQGSHYKGRIVNCSSLNNVSKYDKSTGEILILQDFPDFQDKSFYFRTFKDKR